MRTESKSLRITIPPAREPTGGANEDVSWLRANRLAFPGYPSGIEPIAAARYSGGAAPDLHRLPYPHSQNDDYVSLDAAGRRRNAHTSATRLPAAPTPKANRSNPRARKLPRR